MDDDVAKYCDFLMKELRISPPLAWGWNRDHSFGYPSQYWIWDIAEEKPIASICRSPNQLSMEQVRNKTTRLTHYFIHENGPTWIYEPPINKWSHQIQLALRSKINCIDFSSGKSKMQKKWAGFHHRIAPSPLLSIYKKEQVEFFEKICFSNFLIELAGNILSLFPDKYPFVEEIWDTRYLTKNTRNFARQLVKNFNSSNENWKKKAIALVLPVPLLRMDMVIGKERKIWVTETNTRAYGIEKFGPLHADSRKALEEAGLKSLRHDFTKVFAEQIKRLMAVTGYKAEPIAIIGCSSHVNYISSILIEAGIQSIPIPISQMALIKFRDSKLIINTDSLKRYCDASPWRVDIPNVTEVRQAYIYTRLTNWGIPIGTGKIQQIFEAGLNPNHPFRLLGNSQGPRLENNKAYYSLLQTSPYLQKEVSDIIDLLSPKTTGNRVFNIWVKHRPPAITVILNRLKSGYRLEILNIVESGGRFVLDRSDSHIKLDSQNAPVLDDCDLSMDDKTRILPLLEGNFCYLKQAVGNGAKKCCVFSTNSYSLFNLLKQLRSFPRRTPIVIEKGVAGGKLVCLNPWRENRSKLMEKFSPLIEVFIDMPISGNNRSIATIVTSFNPVQEMLMLGEIPLPNVYKDIYDDLSVPRPNINDRTFTRLKSDLDSLLNQKINIKTTPIMHQAATSIALLSHVKSY